jgi:hypothetical protein
MGGGGAVWRMSGFSIYFLQFVELERNRPLLNCKGIWNSCQAFCQRTLQPFRWEWLYGWYSFINDLKLQLQSQNKSKMLSLINDIHQKSANYTAVHMLYTVLESVCYTCSILCNVVCTLYAVLCTLYAILCMYVLLYVVWYILRYYIE